MKKGLLIIFLCFPSILMFSQDDCFRFPVKAYNIIRNPSFERDGLPCASGFFNQNGLTVPYWTTATDEMVTGYLNACNNFLVPDSIFVKAAHTNRYVFLYPVVPQPIPDGNGVAAVTDFGYNGGQYVYPKHKSYVSTCLPETMQKDSLYRLEFYVGFGNRVNEAIFTGRLKIVPELSPSPEKFSLFGLQNCPDHPVPVVGCPEVGGWIVLGSVKVSGDLGTWVKTFIDFKLPDNINAIALGPSCDTNFVSPQGQYQLHDTLVYSSNYSYFLDKLQLYKVLLPKPTVQITAGSFCEKSVTLEISPEIFQTGFKLQWEKDGKFLNNENNKTLVVSKDGYSAGSYKCRVEKDTVCITSDSLQVSWAPAPKVAAFGDADTTVCEGDMVLLDAFSDSSFTYTWQDGSTSPRFEATASGTYTVSVSNGCITTASQKTVHFNQCKNEIYVPNAFTPNGDGRNDIFKVHYSNPPSQFRMVVYNRYGQKIFISSSTSGGWDGTIDGVQQPVGAYIWVIEYRDHKNMNHTLRGSVVLVR